MIMITLQYCCFYFGSVGGDLVTAGSVGGENARASGARTVYVGEGSFNLPLLLNGLVHLLGHTQPPEVHLTPRLPIHHTLNGPVY